MLPASSPLKCMSPADVYLLLKSSAFVQHDLDPELVFDGCDPAHDPQAPTPYELELVLRKWYPVDRARELRCFVRQEALIGASVRCHPWVGSESLPASRISPVLPGDHRDFALYLDCFVRRGAPCALTQGGLS